MDIEELIAHTNIIIEEGLDSEDDIQSMLKKWKTAYENLKSYNRGTREALKVAEDLEHQANKEAGDWEARCFELEEELEKEKEKNNNVLGLIFEYGQTDGEHHKAWVIDQIVRIITENDYDKWVQHYEYDEETDEDYFWDVGIAP